MSVPGGPDDSRIPGSIPRGPFGAFDTVEALCYKL
jgi:hypothetical protein